MRSTKHIEPEIIRLYKETELTILRISEQMNVCVKTIYNVLERNGLRPSRSVVGRGSRSKICPTQLMMMRRSGMKIREIAAAFGVTTRTINYMVAENRLYVRRLQKRKKRQAYTVIDALSSPAVLSKYLSKDAGSSH